MQLLVNCKSCGELSKIPHDEPSRPYLVDKIGTDFIRRCPDCGVSKQYHVNQVIAKKSNIIRYGGTALGLAILVGVTVGFWITGYFTNIGLIIGGGIIAASNFADNSSNEKAFNSYYI